MQQYNRSDQRFMYTGISMCIPIHSLLFSPARSHTYSVRNVNISDNSSGRGRNITVNAGKIISAKCTKGTTTATAMPHTFDHCKTKANPSVERVGNEWSSERRRRRWQRRSVLFCFVEINKITKWVIIWLWSLCITCGCSTFVWGDGNKCSWLLGFFFDTRVVWCVVADTMRIKKA